MKRKSIYRPSSRLAAVDTSALGFSFFGYDSQDTEIIDGIAVVRIEGPLEHKAGWIWDSYECIVERFAEAIDSSSVSGVVLAIDSPGGDVSGLFETIQTLAEMKANAGKPVVAYCNEWACSAGYALAMVSDELWLPASGVLGSIGIIAMLCDQTGMDAMLGQKVALVTSGARKTDGNPHVPISSEAMTVLQSQVEGLAAMFFEIVAESRGITTEEVQAQQAAIYMGEQALTANLADGLGSLQDAIDRAIALATPQRQTETDSDTKGAAAMALVKRKAPKRAATSETTTTTTVETAAAATECPNGNDDCSGGQECVDGYCAEPSDEEATAAPAEESSALSSLIQHITGETSPMKQAAKLAGMVSQASLAGADMKAERVNAAIKAGKLTPSLKKWAMGLDAKALNEFLGAAQPVVSLASGDSLQEAEPVARHGLASRSNPSVRAMIAKTLRTNVKELENFEKENS